MQNLQMVQENTAKKTYDGPRKEFKKRYDGGGFGGGKKSDNPDVIYGRDIEDGETIPLEKSWVRWVKLPSAVRS